MASEAQIGTPNSHYADALHGPFACRNCVHFASPAYCNHSKVIQDAKNRGEKLRLDDGKAVVNPHGCCDYFRNK